MPHYITCMWNLKYNANELIYKTENRLTDLENKFAVAEEEEVGKAWSGNLGLAEAQYHIWDG